MTNNDMIKNDIDKVELNILGEDSWQHWQGGIKNGQKSNGC